MCSMATGCGWLEHHIICVFFFIFLSALGAWRAAAAAGGQNKLRKRYFVKRHCSMLRDFFSFRSVHSASHRLPLKSFRFKFKSGEIVIYFLANANCFLLPAALPCYLCNFCDLSRDEGLRNNVNVCERKWKLGCARNM